MHTVDVSNLQCSAIAQCENKIFIFILKKNLQGFAHLRSKMVPGGSQKSSDVKKTLLGSPNAIGGYAVQFLACLVKN